MATQGTEWQFIGNADEVRVESDERGFELHIETDEGCYIVNVQAIAEQLYDHVKASIGPWLYEREQAKREFDSRATMPPYLYDEDFEAYVNDAYADDWPKAEGMRQMREKGLI